MSNKRYPINTIKIKTLLLKSGKGITDLAEQINEKRSAVSQVVNGLRPNPRIRKKIARALGVSLSEIVPEEERDAA